MSPRDDAGDTTPGGRQKAAGPRAALAERVRRALLEAALSAYEDAGVQGLCCEGAWEAAVGAMRELDLTPLASDEGEQTKAIS